MFPITITRTIHAPLEHVFRTVADITQFSQALPHIVKVEFLSDVKSGLGARFRETRLMNGKEMRTELEITEFHENDRVRLVAKSHGTVWDTLFTVQPQNGQTVLTLTMDARAHKMFAKAMNYLISGMVKRAVEKDLDAVKVHCEKQG